MKNEASTNVLIIMMDDLAYGDIAAHGNPIVQTPVLDNLREESARLTRYCSGPVCTPARASLFTGRHPYRTRAIDTYVGRSMMGTEEVTMADLFKEAGYRTGLFGKWHLGDCYPLRPIDRGFDQCLMHGGGGLCQPANVGRDSYFNPDLMENGKLRRYSGYCTDIFTRAAGNFIEKSVVQESPFFCFLGTNAPHTPLEAPEALVEKYRHQGIGEKTARIYAMVENIDSNVGALLDRLDLMGIRNNTLVFYTSDHGPCKSASDAPGKIRYNTSLRDAKGTVFEGGLRVPSFWRLPGRLSAGADIDRITGPIDVMPTLADLCNLQLPRDRTIDGVSLLSLMDGSTTTADWPDREIAFQWHRGDQPELKRNACLIGQQYKWIRLSPDEPALLFDLQNDPCETRNLAEELDTISNRMEKAYENWFQDVSSTWPDNYAPPRIVVGSPHETMTYLTWQDWRLYEPENDGWGTDHPGYWEIDVFEEGSYEVTVDLVHNTGTFAVIKCGGHEHRIRLFPKCPTTFQVSAFHLNEGPQRMEAFVEAGDQRVGVRRVSIQRS